VISGLVALAASAIQRADKPAPVDQEKAASLDLLRSMGVSDVTQRNTLKSWALLHSDVEVIVFGAEEGTAEVCGELGLQHEAEVELSEFGTPLLNYAFKRGPSATLGRPQLVFLARLRLAACDHPDRKRGTTTR
jgi:hypothetical protein